MVIQEALLCQYTSGDTANEFFVLEKLPRNIGLVDEKFTVVSSLRLFSGLHNSPVDLAFDVVDVVHVVDIVDIVDVLLFVLVLVKRSHKGFEFINFLSFYAPTPLVTADTVHI